MATVLWRCWLLAVVLLTGCLEKDPNRIRGDHAALDQLIDANAKIEQLASGMTWAEGPVWIDDGGYLLFTDVPANRIHRWSEQDGLSVFLEPSGYSGPTLYVANSDEAHPVWVAYSLGEDGSVSNRRIFADSSDEVAKGTPGVPDGLCIDAHGNIFATGPGGLYIFTPDGTRLGRIETGSLVSNCAFGGDGSVLFITSHHRVVRVPTKTRGLRF